MIQFLRRAILASSVLLSAGCASYDDRMERVEFEKLRTLPVESQEDHVLPVFENGSVVEEALLRSEDAILRIREIWLIDFEIHWNCAEIPGIEIGDRLS